MAGSHCPNGRLRQALRVAALVIALTGTVAPRGSATIQYGPLQLSGNVETQNIMRNTTIEKLGFIQNWNTVRLRLDWDWLQNGRFLDRVNVPFIERSKLYLLYRGTYDGFYGIAPGGRQVGQTRQDDRVGGAITDLPDDFRRSLAWSNTLREAYIDVDLEAVPVNFRIGRQQVIWGESDQFRIMDIWNPLDVTWHFQQESWDNIRIPLWLFKALWNINELGPFSDTYLELVYNAFDFQPGIKIAWLPRPWALPFADPLRPGQVQQITPTLPTYFTPFFDTGASSYTKGAFQRNPADASEVGVRLHVVTPQGIELSANYLYGRSRGIGAAPPFGIRIKSIRVPATYSTANALPSSPGGRCTGIGTGTCAEFGNAAQRPVRVFPAMTDVDIMFPYVNIFGLTGNYFDATYTETVLRWETAFAIGEPYQTKGGTLAPVQECASIDYSSATPQLTNCQVGGLTAPQGYTTRDVWAGMIGFDRPTWLRALNKNSTWFLSGQFFWSYIPGNVTSLTGTSGAGETPYFTPGAPLLGSTSVGFGGWSNVRGWKAGPTTGHVDRLQDFSVKGTGDNIRRWESLITLAATSFYHGGKLVPFLASAWDPVNSNLELLWNLGWFVTNDFSITPFQKYFMVYGGGLPSNDPWYAGGRFHRRSETGVKVTYQF